jgi:hypothetical protein
MTMNIKTVLGVGYLSIDMFRFWHSTVDCAADGYVGSLLAAGLVNMQVVVVVEVEAIAKMPVAG